MAKRASKNARTNVAGDSIEEAGAVSTFAESKLEEFAEDLGRVLGAAKAKAEGWLKQRTALAAQLAQIRDTAQNLLAELAGGRAPKAGQPRRRGPRGRPSSAESRAVQPRTRKRTMSADARAKIAAAQRRRWAKQREKDS